MTDPARSLRWQAALARARKRWHTADAAERDAVGAELDALWAELQGDDRGPPSDALAVGPRHCHLGALLRYQLV